MGELLWMWEDFLEHTVDQGQIVKNFKQLAGAQKPKENKTLVCDQKER